MNLEYHIDIKKESYKRTLIATVW